MYGIYNECHTNHACDMNDIDHMYDIKNRRE